VLAIFDNTGWLEKTDQRMEDTVQGVSRVVPDALKDALGPRLLLCARAPVQPRRWRLSQRPRLSCVYHQLYQKSLVQLGPLPLAGRVAKVVGSSVVVDVVGDLLPLHLGKALFVAECLMMARVDAIEIMLH
jgi:hypothetical protein